MEKLTFGQLAELLAAVGEHLAAAGESASIVVVGGAHLRLKVGSTARQPTWDVIAKAINEDGSRTLVAPDPLPPSLVRAIERVARDYGLRRDWLNTVIGSQWPYGLPPGFAEEIEWHQFGELEVGFAGRQTLIALKLFATVDRGPTSVHAQDLLALRPTEAELITAASWVRTQDASEHFSNHVEEVLTHVRRTRERGDAVS